MNTTPVVKPTEPSTTDLGTGLGAEAITPSNQTEAKAKEVLVNKGNSLDGLRYSYDNRSWVVIFCEEAVKAAAWIAMGAVAYASYPLIQRYRAVSGVTAMIAVIYSFAAQKTLGSSPKSIKNE